MPDLIDRLVERASNEDDWTARKNSVKALGKLAKYSKYVCQRQFSQANCILVEFQEQRGAAQKLITTIKEKLCDDDDEVREGSMQTFIDLVKDGKSISLAIQNACK